MIFLWSVVIINTYSLLWWNRETIAFAFWATLLLLPIMTWKITQVIFDTNAKIVTWSQISIRARKKEILEFSDISNVILESISWNRQRSYRVNMKTKLWDFPLWIWYGYKDGAVKKKTKIEQILTGNYDSNDPPKKDFDDEMIALIQSWKTIDAITQVREKKDMTLTQAKKYIDTLKNNQK